MIYNVAQLLKEPSGAHRSYTVDETMPSPDPAWGELLPLKGELTLRRTPRGVLVTGTLTTTIREECVRCLEMYEAPLTVELEEEYCPSIDVVTGVALKVPDDEPVDLTIDDHHGLDASEAVRQGVLLARDIQSVCKPNCLGLCVTCGKNRNIEPCTCDSGLGDPRWSALRRLSA